MHELKNPSVVEFSLLRGVASCLWSTPISVFPLLKVPQGSDSAAEDTKFLIVFQSVWIEPFSFGVRLDQLV